MKNETNDQSALALAPYSKEQGELDQTRLATFFGCDASKKVSGVEYLLIFATICEEQTAGLSPAAAKQRIVQIAMAMKANNSALRQWLYERREASGKISDKAADLMARFGGTPQA